MAGSSDCNWTEIKETKALQTIEWIVAMLGCALFVFVSRVPQLLVPFMGRSWYVLYGYDNTEALTRFDQKIRIILVTAH